MPVKINFPQSRRHRFAQPSLDSATTTGLGKLKEIDETK
jgi:hypothetical protein